MQYQLVLQFPQDSYDDLDWVAEMEEQIDDFLSENDSGAELDGHDIGSGEINIFINSENPEQTFQALKPLLQDVLIDLKVAYRDFNESDYHCLWPDDLQDFEVV